MRAQEARGPGAASVASAASAGTEQVAGAHPGDALLGGVDAETIRIHVHDAERPAPAGAGTDPARGEGGVGGQLLNQVIDFQRACRPLESMIGRIIEGIRTGALDPSPYPGVSEEEKNEEAVELARQFRNVLDHVVHTKERLEDLRSSLENALRVHDTLLGQQQNDDTKKISAYAALLMVPTIVGSVYGMNFEVMPELKWEFGYPAALLLMVGSCLLLYWFFKKNKWL